MTKGIFLSEDEAFDLFGRLDRLESMLKKVVVPTPERKADEPSVLNRKAAAYYISTGRLPDNLDNPPAKGLTRFDELVNSGDIKCVPIGSRKKLFRKSDLDSFIYRYANS